MDIRIKLSGLKFPALDKKLFYKPKILSILESFWYKRYTSLQSYSVLLTQGVPINMGMKWWLCPLQYCENNLIVAQLKQITSETWSWKIQNKVYNFQTFKID